MTQLPVFYINLDRRPDRRAFMEEQFARLGIVAERVPGVEVASVPDRIALQETARLPFPVSIGDYACGLSHQSIWRQMRDRQLPATLVLEDDAILTPSLLPFLQPDILDRVKADLLKLETRRHRVLLGRVTCRFGQVEVRGLQSTHMGAAAYIISAAAAAASLIHPDLDTVGVDRFLFGKGGPHLLSSRIVQAVPSPTVQLDRRDRKHSGPSEARSDIDGLRVKGKRDRPPTLLLVPNLRHGAKLAWLGLRDPAAMFRKRVAVPFAGDEH